MWLIDVVSVVLFYHEKLSPVNLNVNDQFTVYWWPLKCCSAMLHWSDVFFIAAVCTHPFSRLIHLYIFFSISLLMFFTFLFTVSMHRFLTLFFLCSSRITATPSSLPYSYHNSSLLFHITTCYVWSLNFDLMHPLVCVIYIEVSHRTTPTVL